MKYCTNYNVPYLVLFLVSQTLLNSTGATLLKPKRTQGNERRPQHKSSSSLRDVSGTKRRDHSGSRLDSTQHKRGATTGRMSDKTAITPGNTTNFSTSPEPKGKGSSTPTCDGASMYSMVDVSAIHSTPGELQLLAS